ncbi:Dredd family protein [Megaselia abdita]
MQTEKLLSAKDLAERLDQISFEDLKFLENDLSARNKVSLAFLLHDKSTSNFILQKLMVLHSNDFNDSDLLQEFAQTRKRWKEPLLEALTLLKAKKVIRKMGFDYEILKKHFLPHIAQTSLEINLIVKNLYILCEKMTMVEGGRLILTLQDNDSFKFFDNTYLEIFLLHWITESKISVDPPNLDTLVQYFKVKEKDNLKELLLDAVKFSENNIALKSRLNTTTTVDDDHEEKLTRELSVSTNSFTSLDDRSMAYQVRKERAGILFVINQKTFYKNKDEQLKEYHPEEDLAERIGTDNDRDSLVKVFKEFGYRTVERNDLKHDEIMCELNEVIGRSYMYDSLIVCVLSHGIKDHFYGSNSIPFKIKRIEERMKEAPQLVGKPKILLIQACQGAEKQIPITIEHDGPKGIPSQQDVLIGFSTVPGFASFRNKITGTWYIQTLCQKVEELGDKKHFSDILTAVNYHVGTKRSLENECMTPTLTSTLSRDFYLPRRF